MSSTRVDDTAVKNGAGTDSADGKKVCSICSVEPESSLIISDANYLKILKLYYESLKVDIKPMELTQQKICVKCFDALVELYDTNDICVILEKQLDKARVHLINTTVSGIKALEKADKTLTPIQKRIIDKYPVLKEDPDGNSNDNGVTYATSLENPKSKKGGKHNASVSSDNCESDSTASTATVVIPHSKKAANSPVAARGGPSKRGKPSAQPSPASNRPRREISKKPKAYTVDNDSDNDSE